MVAQAACWHWVGEQEGAWVGSLALGRTQLFMLLHKDHAGCFPLGLLPLMMLVPR